MATKTTSPLKSKILRLQKIREQAKALYGHADALLDELTAAMEPGDTVPLGKGKVAVMVDQFAEKSVVFRPCGVRRFELKITDEAA